MDCQQIWEQTFVIHPKRTQSNIGIVSKSRPALIVIIFVPSFINFRFVFRWCHFFRINVLDAENYYQ